MRRISLLLMLAASTVAMTLFGGMVAYADVEDDVEDIDCSDIPPAIAEIAEVTVLCDDPENDGDGDDDPDSPDDGRGLVAKAKAKAGGADEAEDDEVEAEDD